jgi:CIC family chloride channel protein
MKSDKPNIINSINKVKSYFTRLAFPEYTLFSFYAILIGIAAGLSSVIFHLSIVFLNEILFGRTTQGLYFLGAAAVIIIPAIGMLIQSVMITSAPEISKKRGVLEVIKAVALRGGLIPLRTTIFHFFAPVICIGSGGTVGPEGPAAQIGGGVASKIATLLKLSDHRKRTFTAAGAGAAIAAIFNTPLGGVFFALEIVLLNDLQTTTFSALILASVTSSATSRIFLGNESVFSFSVPHIGDYQYFYLFILFGIVCGIISISFLKYDQFTSQLFKKKILKSVPRWVIMILVGFVVGISGYFYKDIFGIGYNGINDVLMNSFTWQVVLVLFILKFLLVPLVLNSGGFGGTFAPSLFMGAMAGYLFSFGVSILTGIPTDPTTYILVGMGATLGGINSIPITAILMIFEMTREYSLMLPLMLSVIVSSTIVQIINKGSYHLKLLERQGFRISEGRETSILKSILVETVMRNDPIILNLNTPLNKIVPRLIDSPHRILYTVDANGKLVGAITDSQVRPLITEYESVKKSVIAHDIADTGLIRVKSFYDLDFVLKLLTKADVEELPVVSDEDESKIIGVIRRQDVLDTYHRESIKHDLADGLSKEIQTLNKLNISRIADGYAIVERKPDTEFVGKTLAELKLRNKYDLEVLMIKKSKELFDEADIKTKIIMPRYDYRLEKDDILVLFGTEEKILKSADW